MTDTIRRTLAELNANPYRRDWGNYTLETRYHVGRTGSSRRGTSGAKTHLVVADYVVAEKDGHKPGTYGVGDRFSIHGACNGNGQHNGTVLEKLDTDAISCAKCASRLGGR